IQLAKFLGRAAEGDLGTDPWTERSIGSIVMENLPYTLVLIGAGLGWAALVGIPLGCFSAIRRNSWIDRVAGVVSLRAVFLSPLRRRHVCPAALRDRARLVPGDRRRRGRRFQGPALASGAAELRRGARLGRLSGAHRARFHAGSDGGEPRPNGARLRPAGEQD